MCVFCPVMGPRHEDNSPERKAAPRSSLLAAHGNGPGRGRRRRRRRRRSGGRGKGKRCKQFAGNAAVILTTSAATTDAASSVVD